MIYTDSAKKKLSNCTQAPSKDLSSIVLLCVFWLLFLTNGFSFLRFFPLLVCFAICRFDICSLFCSFYPFVCWFPVVGELQTQSWARGFSRPRSTMADSFYNHSAWSQLAQRWSHLPKFTSLSTLPLCFYISVGNKMLQSQALLYRLTVHGVCLAE